MRNSNVNEIVQKLLQFK